MMNEFVFYMIFVVNQIVQYFCISFNDMVSSGN